MDKTTAKSIVFMYHGVIKDDPEIPPSREPGAELYDVSLKNFYEQMKFLNRNNYRVVTYQLEQQAATHQEIVLTFDDGELNNYQEAWPVLKMYRFPAYFFVTVNRIGRLGYMGWKELRELSGAGMIVGSHGLTHEILTGLSPDKLKRELLDSRNALEQNLKKDVRDFSVPRGFYNDEVLKIAKECGYSHIFVSDEEPRSPLCVGRVAVQNYWSLKRFQMALHGQKPFDEQIYYFCKNNIKRLLGRRGYNGLRSTILKFKK